MSLPLFAEEEAAAEAGERCAGERTLAEVERRLLARDGPPAERAFWEPLKELIYVFLSARTRTEVSHAVLAALEVRYGAALGDWRGLRDAPEAEVLSILAPVTFPEVKTPRLQAALRRITRQNDGVLSLDFFQGQSVERIRRWLESFEGMGARGSAAVANHSSLRLRALVMDTHHHRVTQRMGLVPRGTAAAAAEALMLERMPGERWEPARLTTFHDLMKRHGQLRCKSFGWEEHCAGCPLLALCPTGQAVESGAEPGAGDGM